MIMIWNMFGIIISSWTLRNNNRNCICPLANVGYTNLLLHIPTMIKVAENMVKELI